MNVKQAKSLAFGSTKSESLHEYYMAWQYLLDHRIDLSEPDTAYLQKLIEDGIVVDIIDK